MMKVHISCVCGWFSGWAKINLFWMCVWYTHLNCPNHAQAFSCSLCLHHNTVIRSLCAKSHMWVRHRSSKQMCVDRFHIVSLFLFNPCTPSTLSKEAFVYFVCPTEIPQPLFAWKYYHTVSMWSNNHHELFARQLIHSYDLVNSAFKIRLSHNVFSHKWGGGVKNTFRNTAKYLWYSRQFEQKFVRNLRNRLPQTKDWHMVYSLRVTASLTRWFEATRPLEFLHFLALV